jgi:anti-sigma factor ChrR (cupin superfamily)
MSHDDTAAGAAHLPAEGLLDYWLGDSDAAATEAIDAHLMQCDTCGQALDELVALGHGIRDALRAGTVGGVVGAAFLQRLAGQGLQVREYRVPPGGSVNCSVAPGDELLVSHLALPQPLRTGLRRLDLHVELSLEPGVRHELLDIPFDPQAGEVLYVHKIAEVRPRPAHTAQATLVAVDGAGARELGRYVFHHRPWQDGA